MRNALILLAALSTAGCATKDAFYTTQQWQKQQCAKLPDLNERARCEKSASASYESYKARSESQPAQ